MIVRSFVNGTGGMVGEWFRLAAGTAIYQGVSLLFALAVASSLGPTEFAVWGVVLMTTVYASYGQMGVVQGLARELPIAIGSGQMDRIPRLERAALTGVLTAASLAGLTVLLININTISVMQTSAAVLYAGIYQLHVYSESVLRAKGQFRRFGWYQIVAAIMLGCGILIISSDPRLSTVLWVQCASFIAAIVTAAPEIGINWRITFSRREWVNLVKPGIPILLSSVGFELLRTADRWSVIWAEGLERAGVYFFYVRIAAASLVFSALVAVQFYPRMARLYGQTRTVTSLLALLKKQISSTLLVSIITAFALQLAVPPIVNLFWSSYHDGLYYFPILLLGGVFLPQTLCLGQFFAVIGRQWEYVGCMIVAVIVGAGAIVSLAYAFGATGSAIGSTFASAFYLGVLGCWARRLIARENSGRGTESRESVATVSETVS